MKPFNKMGRNFRSRWLLFAGAVILAISLGLFLYLTGRWIPNLPSDGEFPVRGIDVSHHQGIIDWTKIPKKIAFVYIKATEGGDWKDPRFKANWADSSATGIYRGAYHFFSLRIDGEEQARNFIDAVPLEPNTLPPAIDLEFGGNSKFRPTVQDFQRELTKTIDILRQHYQKEPVIYTTHSFRRSYLDRFPIQHLWIRDVFRSPKTSVPGQWDIWQFTGNGRMPGIPKSVDLNVFHGSPAAFESFVKAGLSQPD